MSQELRARLFAELDSLVLIDPHTHINPHEPASKTLADILGYHYYTELAHSAGMAKSQIEELRLDPREKVRRLIANLGPINNTIQYSWFVEMAQALLGFQGDSIDESNWEEVYDLADSKMSSPSWDDEVLKKSKLEAVFLTNDFDDPLSGFDTDRYIPCLRTDDLVFHLAKVETVERLERATGTSVNDAASLKDAIANLFTHFKANGARACAISLPPDFSPAKVSAGRAETAVDSLLRRGLGASEADRRAVANFVFWTLAEYCAEFKLPFDLMIGVNRGVYETGVHQGRDLYDSRVSLIQYKQLFNSFKKVVFPISVLASVTNQELTSYAWIFPNVVTNGHWWYSNTPTYIEHDLAGRLEAVPRTKQVGYYSDMYKLEFALPKFAMYKRILAKVLAERYVIDRNWSEEKAVDFGKQILRGNVETLFGFQGEPWTPNVEEEPAWTPPAASESAWKPTETGAAGLAALALGGAAVAGAGALDHNDFPTAEDSFGADEGTELSDFGLESENSEDLEVSPVDSFKDLPGEPFDPSPLEMKSPGLEDTASFHAAESFGVAQPFEAESPVEEIPAAEEELLPFAMDADDQKSEEIEMFADLDTPAELPPGTDEEMPLQFSLEASEPDDEASMFAELESPEDSVRGESAAEEAEEELAEIELEEGDVESLDDLEEIELEALEPEVEEKPAGQFDFLKFDDKKSADKKSGKKPRTGANPNDDFFS